MLNFLIEIFKIKDLRKNVIFILFVFLVYRILAAIPVPGINLEQLKRFFENNQLFGLLGILTGGGFFNFSIVMLGLGPYITAIIIMQLLTILYPRLKEIYYEEGEIGRQKFYYYSKVLTVPLAALQAYGFTFLLQNQGILQITHFSQLLQIIILATAGAMMLVWLSELITEKGLGNGASLLIFAGIVARVVPSVSQAIQTYTPEQLPSYLMFLIIATIVIAGVTFINEAQRQIPVVYARNVRGKQIGGGIRTYLPLKINMAGVIPIIFALSIILFPALIGNIFINLGNPMLEKIGIFLRNFSNQGPLYIFFYFILVFFFTFFYTAITFEPKEVAQNLQKMGGFIPGVRPGKETEKYLASVAGKVTFPGAIALGIIAILPLIVQNITGVPNLTIGGTAILIVVSVVLDSYKHIKAQIAMREYEKI